MKKIVAATTATIAVSSVWATTASAAEYSVKSGDSLWAISEQYGTSVSALKAENGLSSDLIFPNQVLKINEKNSAVKQTSEVNNSSDYLIIAGDTLGTIAAKYNVSVADLKAWNNLSSDLIIAGKTLKVSGQQHTQAYVAPVQQYQAPAQPVQQYQAPAQPVQQYQAPAQPVQQYQAPQYVAPKPAAPQKVYQAPKAATTQTASTGGQNWAALAACESGGNANIVSSNGLYHGLYQFDVQTWRGVGGSGLPSQASAAEQTKRAQILYSMRGSQPWPVCGARL